MGVLEGNSHGVLVLNGVPGVLYGMSIVQGTLRVLGVHLESLRLLLGGQWKFQGVQGTFNGSTVLLGGLVVLSRGPVLFSGCFWVLLGGLWLLLLRHL